MKSIIDVELNKALGPIRRRLILKSLVQMAALGFIAALFQALIWLIISFFVPIFNLELKMAAAGGIIFVLACILGFAMKPSISQIAREIDSKGLEERVITAVELAGRDDPFARLQRQDTIEELKSFNPRSIAINISKSMWITVGSLTFALIIGFLIPNPQEEFIHKQLQFEKTIEEQLQKLEEKAEKELAKSAKLTEEERQQIQNLLRELAQELRESKDYREAIKEVTETEEKLMELFRRAQEAKLAQLGEGLSKYQVTQSLGEKLKKMDKQGIAEELRRLKELAQGDADKQLMEALQKALEEVAQQLPEGDLKSSMLEAANAISAGLVSNNIPSNVLDGLEGQLMQLAENAIDDPENIMYMLQNMKNQIAQTAGQDISKLASAGTGQQNQQNLQNQSGSQSQGSHGSSNGQSASGSSNQGSGMGNSSGVGNSSSPSGSGTGENSFSTDSQGIGGQGFGGQGAGIGSSHGEYEKIYDPKRLGDGGESSQVSGKAGEEGNSEQVDAGRGLGSFDGFVPYNEVFGEYKSQAMLNLDRMDIPQNMRELVKKYFSSLED